MLFMYERLKFEIFVAVTLDRFILEDFMLKSKMKINRNRYQRMGEIYRIIEGF